MGEKNKFVVIDEKPKHGQKRHPYTPSITWLMLTSLLMLTFLVGIGIVCTLASTQPVDCCIDAWTGTAIVATNKWIGDMLTLTQNATLMPPLLSTSAP